MNTKILKKFLVGFPRNSDVYIYIYITVIWVYILMCSDIDLLFPVVLCTTSKNIFRSIVMNATKRRKINSPP